MEFYFDYGSFVSHHLQGKDRVPFKSLHYLSMPSFDWTPSQVYDSGKRFTEFNESILSSLSSRRSSCETFSGEVSG